MPQVLGKPICCLDCFVARTHLFLTRAVFRRVRRANGSDYATMRSHFRAQYVIYS